MQEGIIVKGVGGLYVVKTNGGNVKARPRGRFRKDHIVPMVGDRVSIEKNEGAVRIDEIMPRKNALVRPPVANIDKLCIVTAASSPQPDLFLLDKLTVSALFQKIEVFFCINKIDLKDPDEVTDIYEKAGFTVFRTCAKQKTGIEPVKKKLKGCITAVAGASGVGKSSLLNALDERLTCEVSAISQKIERGRNTTRHTEIFEIEQDSFIFDTPGFSSFEVPQIAARDLVSYFPDLDFYADGCQFADCSHTKEMGCQVLEALSQEKISRSRHESYVKLYTECKSKKEWENK